MPGRSTLIGPVRRVVPSRSGEAYPHPEMQPRGPRRVDDFPVTIGWGPAGELDTTNKRIIPGLGHEVDSVVSPWWRILTDDRPDDR